MSLREELEKLEADKAIAAKNIALCMQREHQALVMKYGVAIRGVEFELLHHYHQRIPDMVIVKCVNVSVDL